MTTNLIELRKLAEAATPGKWDNRETRIYLPNIQGGFDISYTPNAINNAAYIAAANPAKLIELLDTIEAQAKQIEALQADAERYRWLRDVSNLYRDHPAVYSAIVEGFTSKEIEDSIDASRKGNV